MMMGNNTNTFDGLGLFEGSIYGQIHGAPPGVTWWHWEEAEKLHNKLSIKERIWYSWWLCLLGLGRGNIVGVLS